MLMTRPFLAFIIPRRHALETRNAPLRFVDRTSSHSSAFMRISRLSRVMPALLTTMVGLPSCDWMSLMPACTDSSSAMSMTMPRPRVPSLSPMAFAPASLVAVPTTTAPAAARASAMAAPMPRDAPVTSAISPSRAVLEKISFIVASSIRRLIVKYQGLFPGLSANQCCPLKYLEIFGV